MEKARRFWYGMMTGGVISWFAMFALSYGLYIAFPDHPIKAWIPFGIEFLIHVGEIPYGIKLGHARGLSAQRSGLKTFIFGFTWWLPMKRGIIDK